MLLLWVMGARFEFRRGRGVRKYDNNDDRYTRDATDQHFLREFIYFCPQSALDTNNDIDLNGKLKLQTFL